MSSSTSLVVVSLRDARGTIRALLASEDWWGLPGAFGAQGPTPFSQTPLVFHIFHSRAGRVWPEEGVGRAGPG
eukprot:6729678-Alexandrium_andersonii.AAC.1